MPPLIVENAYVWVGDGVEHPSGHVVCEGNRIAAVGPGPAPAAYGQTYGVRVVDATGCLVTPGLVDTHGHLFQGLTRGAALGGSLTEWLAALYPVWAHLDADLVRTAATAGLTRLARSGCTTSTDHAYLHPRGGGDLLAAGVEAARCVGVRHQAVRGSMDLGEGAGGLAPDGLVEDRDAALAASRAAVERHHDPAPGSMTRVALGPGSLTTASADLLRGTAELARSLGVRLHTHLAETPDEEAYCLERSGVRPLDHLAGLGWLGPDVWFAHAVHLGDADVARLAATGTSVAHCPSSNGRLGAGVARVRDLRDAGVAVGLGVDGAASSEASSLRDELRQALLSARAVGGPRALSVRGALEMATMGGARVLGRADEIGALVVGRCADLAVWRLDTLAHVDVADPVAALVLGTRPPLELLLVDGRPVVEHDECQTVDEERLTHDVQVAHRTLASRAGLRS